MEVPILTLIKQDLTRQLMITSKNQTISLKMLFLSQVEREEPHKQEIILLLQISWIRQWLK